MLQFVAYIMIVNYDPKIVIYDHSLGWVSFDHSFVQAIVVAIVNYNNKISLVLATVCSLTYDPS